MQLRSTNTSLDKNAFRTFIQLEGLFSEHLYQIFDKKQDEQISYLEFLNGIAKFCKSDSKTLIRSIFNLYKFNQNSSVVKQKSFKKMLYHLPTHIINQLLQINMDRQSAKRKLSMKVGTEAVQLQRRNRTKILNEEEGTTLNSKIEVCTKVIFLIHFQNREEISFAQFQRYIKTQKKILDYFHNQFSKDIWSYDTQKGQYFNQAIKPIFANHARYKTVKGSKRVFLKMYDEYLFFFDGEEREQPFRIAILLNVEASWGKDLISVDFYYKQSSKVNYFNLAFDSKEDYLSFFRIVSPIAKKSFYSKYQTLEIIGKGDFTIVYLSKKLKSNSKDQQFFAVKKVKKKGMNEKQKQLIQNETFIIKKLKHRFIIKYFEEFNDIYNSFYVFEYVQGINLWKLLKLHKKLGEKTVRIITRQIFVAVNYLHQRSIIHRDIKPENIMINTYKKIPNKIRIKIIDFGLSCYFGQQDPKIVCGTPNFIAPEVIKAVQYNEKIDVFSIGVTMYYLLSGRLPIKAKNTVDLITK